MCDGDGVGDVGQDDGQENTNTGQTSNTSDPNPSTSTDATDAANGFQDVANENVGPSDSTDSTTGHPSNPNAQAEQDSVASGRGGIGGAVANGLIGLLSLGLLDATTSLDLDAPATVDPNTGIGSVATTTSIDVDPVAAIGLAIGLPPGVSNAISLGLDAVDIDLGIGLMGPEDGIGVDNSPGANTEAPDGGPNGVGPGMGPAPGEGDTSDADTDTNGNGDDTGVSDGSDAGSGIGIGPDIGDGPAAPGPDTDGEPDADYGGDYNPYAPDPTLAPGEFPGGPVGTPNADKKKKVTNAQEYNAYLKRRNSNVQIGNVASSGDSYFSSLGT